MSKYAKAFVAAAVAGLSVLLTALDDNAVTAAEWVSVAIAALGGFGATWLVPNKPTVVRRD